MFVVIILVIALLTAAGLSLAYIIGAASVVTFILSGRAEFLAVLPQRMYSQINLFVFLALPMFVLAGEIIGRSGVSRALMDLTMVAVGRLKGGLGHVNIMASIFLAGISGSAIADTAMISNTLVPEMKKRGYPGAYAAAITAASSIIGPIIPPSVVLILYGALFKLSVGTLFVAGVVPGLLMGGVMMLTNTVVATYEHHPGGSAADCPPLRASLIRALPALSLPAVILGGIAFGIATPTETGAMAVVLALGCGWFYGGISWRSFWEGLEKTVVTVGPVFGILAALSIFSWLAALERVPQAIALWINGHGLTGYAYFLAMFLVFVVAGAVADIGLSLFLLAPLLVPAAVAQGFHPIHVAIVVTVTMVLGGATPPVGPLLLVAGSIAGENYWKTSLAVLPLVAGQFLVVLGLIFFPDLVLFLPRLLGMAP